MLDLQPSAWSRVRLGHVVDRSRKQVDPITAEVQRYVGGGHIDGDSLTVDRWGDPSDGHMGSTFRFVFEPGQVLFVSARPYLRKTGLVNFSGVVADKTYVLDATPGGGLLQAFLPLVLSSDVFVSYASGAATGSMNPRLLWGPMQKYEFALPPLEEQRRIADLMWAVERHRHRLREELAATRRAVEHEVELAIRSAGRMVSIGDVAEINPEQASRWDPTASIDYIDIASVMPDAQGLDEAAVKSMAFGEAPGRARRIVRAGDILVSTVRPGLRSVARIPPTLHGQLASTGFAVLRPGPEISPSFLWQLVCSDRFTNDMISKSTGSAYPAVRGSDVASFQFGLPTRPIAASLDEMMRLAEKATLALAREASALDRLWGSLQAAIFGGN